MKIAYITVSQICIIGTALVLCACSKNEPLNVTESKASNSASVIAAQKIPANVSLSATTIDPEISIYSLRIIYDSLRRMKSLNPRDQFETLAEFEARILSTRAQRLFGDVRLDRPLAFELGNVKYNADREKIVAEFTPYPGFAPETQDATESGMHLYSWLRHQSRVSLVDPKFIGKQIAIEHSMSRQDARIAVQRLKVILIATIAPPFLVYRPHVDNVLDIYMEEHEIPIRVEGVWLIDSENGLVVSKKYKVRTPRL